MLVKVEVKRKQHEAELLGFSLGVTRMDRIRTECLRGTDHVRRFEDKVRETLDMFKGETVNISSE